MNETDDVDVLRDILALSSLPALWVGRDPAFVARGVRDALSRILPATGLIVRVESRDRVFVESTPTLPNAAVEAVEDVLRALPGGFPPPDVFDVVIDGATWRAYGVPMSSGRNVVVGLSRSEAFPSPGTRLVIGLAASQAGTTLRTLGLQDDLVTTRRELAAREREAALGMLVSGVAHEIRTPLTYISNVVEVLRLRDRSPETEELVEAALDGVRRIDALVQQLRRFSPKDTTVKRELDLSGVVEQAVRLFAATHRGGADIACDLAPTGPLLVDSLLIQQAVLNLVENAWDATAGTVRIRTRRAENGGIVEVEDDGRGIDPAHVPRVFDPFFTTKPHGMGLGLSIVRRVAEAHSGHVDVSRLEPSGTRFRIVLPASPERALAPAATSVAPSVPLEGPTA